MSTHEYKYPFMKGLLAGSFFQCWEEFDGREPDEILNDVINESKASEVDGAINELNEILKILDQHTIMKNLIGQQFGCNYSPKYDGESEVEWLVEIKNKLEQARKKSMHP